MKTVGQICEALFELAPESMKESWDNVGLLCGHAGQPVKKVLVALDPFPDVAEEAKVSGVQLLLTHHPLIFGSIQAVNDQNAVGRTLLTLIENGIAAVNLHTNLDSAPGGVNDCLASVLELEGVQVLMPAGTDAQGRAYGLCRYGVIEPCSLPVFLHRVRDRLQCGGVRYTDGGRKVHRVAVGGGACGDFLEQAARLGCDTFVTSDLKYNQFADARELGINLVDAGHFPTENLVCRRLGEWLQSRCPEVEVLVSQKHEDVVKFL